MFSTFSQFIDEKGVEKLAIALKMSPNTIYSYKTRGGIPRDRWPELLAEFEDLTLGDLRRMEDARKAAKLAE